MIHKLAVAVKEVMHDEHVLEVASKTAEGGSYAAAGGTVVSGLTVNEWGVVAGIALGFLTYVTKVYFEKQRLKILREQGVKP